MKEQQIRRADGEFNGAQVKKTKNTNCEYFCWQFYYSLGLHSFISQAVQFCVHQCVGILCGCLYVNVCVSVSTTYIPANLQSILLPALLNRPLCSQKGVFVCVRVEGPHPARQHRVSLLAAHHSLQKRPQTDPHTLSATGQTFHTRTSCVPHQALRNDLCKIQTPGSVCV